MTIIQELATTLGRRDEVPNQELAKRIVDLHDKEAIRELFDLVKSARTGIAGDAIKVVYEVAKISPGLIAPFSDTLVSLLKHKNNRLQWGAMMALDGITKEFPQRIFAALGEILDSADKGSVITNDHCVSILIKLCTVKKYADEAFALFLERLKLSPVNQLPMYAEKALVIINDKNCMEFINALSERLGEVEKESKKSRVEKIIKMAKTFSY